LCLYVAGIVTVVISVTVVVEAFAPALTVTVMVGVIVMVTTALQSSVAVARPSKTRPSDPPPDIAVDV
jgi:uncharacterized membrane protein HdeD (DUF308 family)